MLLKHTLVEDHYNYKTHKKYKVYQTSICRRVRLFDDYNWKYQPTLNLIIQTIEASSFSTLISDTNGILESCAGKLAITFGGMKL